MTPNITDFKTWNQNLANLDLSLGNNTSENLKVIPILVSILAAAISFVSLYRTRKYNELRLEFDQISADLNKKQLSKIEESELKEDQPNFTAWMTRMSCHGDPNSPDFRIIIKFKIENTGSEYLEPKSVRLVSLQKGIFLSSSVAGASLEYIDIRERDPIIGDHTLALSPNSKLTDCKLHIRYIDKKGFERIQEFKVLAYGPPDFAPEEVVFELNKIYKVKRSKLWVYQY